METARRHIHSRLWTEKDKKWVMILFALSLIGYGFLSSSTLDIIKGLRQIIIHPDSLITD